MPYWMPHPMCSCGALLEIIETQEDTARVLLKCHQLTHHGGQFLFVLARMIPMETVMTHSKEPGDGR